MYKGITNPRTNVTLPKISCNFAMEQHIFAFSLIIESNTEKVLYFIMPLKSMQVSLNKKCIFEHCRHFQPRKTLSSDIIFAMKKNLLTFSELPPICLCQYYTKMCCSIQQDHVASQQASKYKRASMYQWSSWQLCELAQLKETFHS